MIHRHVSTNSYHWICWLKLKKDGGGQVYFCCSLCFSIKQTYQAWEFYELKQEERAFVSVWANLGSQLRTVVWMVHRAVSNWVPGLRTANLSCSLQLSSLTVHSSTKRKASQRSQFQCGEDLGTSQHLLHPPFQVSWGSMDSPGWWYCFPAWTCKWGRSGWRVWRASGVPYSSW